MTPATMSDDDVRRLHEALLLYVAGTLDAPERAWVDAQVQAHPAAAQALAAEQALHAAFQADARAALAHYDAGASFDAVLARARREGPAGVAQPAAPRASAAPTAAPSGRPSGPATGQASGPWQTLLGWWQRPSAQGWRLAQGLAFGVLVASLGLGLVMNPALRGGPVDEGGATDIRGAKGWADGPLLRVNFRPDTPEQALRLAVLQARCLIIAGPTRLGDYYLKPAPGQMAAARANLERSAQVEAVAEVPGLPPEMLE